MVWSSWQYFWRYFSQFIFSSFAKGLGLRFVIVSILFWLWELSLPVRGAWERGSSWGSSYTERERRHPKNNPPKTKFVAFSHFTRPLSFSHDKCRVARGCRRVGERGRAAASAGQPGQGRRGSRCSGPRSAVSEQVFRRVGAAGRCQPPDVCRALFANTWQVTGGRRGEATAASPCLLPCGSLGFSRRRFDIEFVGKKKLYFDNPRSAGV